MVRSLTLVATCESLHFSGIRALYVERNFVACLDTRLRCVSEQRSASETEGAVCLHATWAGKPWQDARSCLVDKRRTKHTVPSVQARQGDQQLLASADSRTPGRECDEK